MKYKIAKVLETNICSLTGLREEDYQKDDYKWEIREIADSLDWVFNSEHVKGFTKDQKIGIIKYEYLQCWHKLVSENVYEKVYDDIFR
jgi:hypothetical protein